MRLINKFTGEITEVFMYSRTKTELEGAEWSRDFLLNSAPQDLEYDYENDALAGNAEAIDFWVNEINERQQLECRAQELAAEYGWEEVEGAEREALEGVEFEFEVRATHAAWDEMVQRLETAQE